MMLYEAAAAWDASMAAWGASAATRKCRSRLLQLLERRGWQTIERVTRTDVEQFLADPSFKPWTRCTYYSHLNTFFKWAMGAELISVDPMTNVRRPQPARTKPKPLSEAQVEALLEIARGQSRAFLLLALYAGLRSHEIAKLCGEHVEEDNIFVLGKGGKEAYIPTHPKIWALAQDHPRRGYWFPSHTDAQHVTGNFVGIKIGYLFRDVGITTGSIHRCRHTYATRLLRQGTNIRVVQDVMRHSSLATTQVYLEVTDAERRNAIGALS